MVSNSFLLSFGMKPGTTSPGHDGRGEWPSQFREAWGKVLANKMEQISVNEKPPDLAACSHPH